MKKILDALFSMQLTVVLLLMFALSAAVATFIENDFGTAASKVAVYNATWFEVLLVLLAVNLGGSLVANRIWQRKKYTVFIFHISFIIILIGAAITRYHGFEGMMHIREGESSDEIVSDKTYYSVKLPDNDQLIRKEVLMSGFGWQAPDFTIETGDEQYSIETVDFVPNAAVVITEAINGNPVASLMVATRFGRQNLVLKPGDVKTVDDFSISFSDISGPNTLNLFYEDEQLLLMAPDTVFIRSMGSRENDTILPLRKAPINPMQLYDFNNNRIVLRSFEPSGTVRPVPSNQEQGSSGLDAALLEVTSGSQTKEVIVWGTKGLVGDFTNVEIDGQTFELAYGSIPIELPFRIHLNDFILDRYPGSNSPSSFASEITLIDKEKNEKFDFRIYMNHILTHRGYRFYQSSYDSDEGGTILSVNHDAPGTIVSYMGYALMAAGMIFSLISRKTRFRGILRAISETRAQKTKLLSMFLLPLMLMPGYLQAQTDTKKVNGVTIHVPREEHADKFGELIVLSPNNRLEPMNTLSSKLLRKLTGKSSFEGLNPDQAFLGVLTEPGIWQNVPIIKIKHKELQRLLNLRGKYAAFNDFFDFSKQNSYLLSELVNKAYQKKPADQSKFDQALIKADEKVNIFYLMYTGSYLRLFPRPGAASEKWYAPDDEVSGVAEGDSNFIKNVIPMYVESLLNAYEKGDYSTAEEIVSGIDLYQKKYAADILPSERKQYMEILYNKVEVFEHLYKYYGLFGLIYLLVLFINVVSPRFRIGILNKIFIAVLGIMFIFQTLGLAARWYISGHAPLSNGYESMIFIAWATMLAGFLLVRRSSIALAATTVLASLTLFVAHLNWMNPEVTNLVPVLKSIWLTIHVAIITASYGFLGLGMVLGLFNLLLMIFQGRKNLKVFNLTIREITFTAEATITIGLYMLTIGTFLGGIWANESWGRYWGWDPKETWALVTILVYAVIIHMNFIPGLMGRYLFNALAVMGFASVLMTYFGVNYYLTGLHSYAGGDPVPIPTFVYYTIAILIGILLAAFINNRRIMKITAKASGKK